MRDPTADRASLIRLISTIQNSSGCIIDLDALITKFEQSVPNPSASQYIFDPPDGKHRTAEQIVAIAMKID